MSSHSEHPVIAAIDIGKTYSSCVFSFSYRPTEIKSMDSIQKVQTVLLFNQNGDFHSIGNKAEDYFKQLKDEEKKNWYYFKDFHHISNEHKPTDLEITECSGKKLKTYKVYGSVIKFFKEQISTWLKKSESGLEDYIYFVLTVPPIFSRSQDCMLREAFLFAGLKDNYSFVNEPEAFLSYWEHMWYEIQELPEHVDLKKKCCFLLVNLKGTTATVTASSIKQGTPDRLAFVSGGGWGGQAAYEEFKQFLIKIAGAPIFLESIEQGSLSHLELQKYFESRSKYFGSRTTENFRIDEIAYLYEKEYNEDIKTVVQNSSFSKSVTFKAGCLRIERSFYKGFFKKTLEKITSNITNILQKEDVNGIKVIIMVGYFSELKLVQDAVKSAFPECRFLFPTDPEFTLLKGAVLVGHHTPRTRSIVSKYTVWAHMLHVNDERGFPEVLEDDTKIIIKKGERNEERILNCEFELDTFDMEYVEIKLYTSPNRETYASLSKDNEGVQIINKERINFNGTHRITIEVTIDLYLDSSIIRVPTLPGKREKSVIFKMAFPGREKAGNLKGTVKIREIYGN